MFKVVVAICWLAVSALAQAQPMPLPVPPEIEATTKTRIASLRNPRPIVWLDTTVELPSKAWTTPRRIR